MENFDECLRDRLGLTLVALDHGLFEINMLLLNGPKKTQVLFTSANFPFFRLLTYACRVQEVQEDLRAPLLHTNDKYVKYGPK